MTNSVKIKHELKLFQNNVTYNINIAKVKWSAFQAIGELASNDKQHASVMGPHISKVYSNHRSVTWEVANDINQRDIISKIDHPIEWKEIKLAITKLINERSPRLNEVPPDAYKNLSDQTLTSF